jgi:serine/threonine-protein kinase
MAEDRFGPYRLDALIGRGGMGEVHRAFDTGKKRTVALKRLPPYLADDRDFQARFRREAEVAARLTEPHIIPIHDFGDIDGRLFIDMRLVNGTDLATLLAEEGPLPPTRAVGIVVQVAGALAAAHSENLVHRDVKPSNILLTTAIDAGADEYVYLVDFGLAHTPGATEMTATGLTIGTLAYMAPERFLGRQIDHRVDIYALGCVLYESLTATRPFPGEGGAELMYSHLNTPPPALAQSRPDLPPGLDAVIARAMAKDPDERYIAATDFAAAARAAIAPLPAVTTTTATTPTAAPAAPTPTFVAPRTAAATAEHLAASETVGDGPAVTRVPPSEPARRIRRKPLLIAALLVAILIAGGIAWATVPRDPTLIYVGRFPVEVAVSPDGRHAYVTNNNSGSVSVIDTDSDSVTATVTVGTAPSGIAVAPDGRHAYATNQASGSVSVIDTDSNTVTATIPVGQGPGDIAVSPDGRRAYTTNRLSGSVSVIDTGSTTVTATVPFTNPWDVAVSPDGRRAYISDAVDSVSVLDTATNTIIARIPAGSRPEGVAVSPDGRHVYASNAWSHSVSVIDTASNNVTATVSLSFYDATEIAVSSDGRRAYTAGGVSTHEILVIDTATNTVTAKIPVVRPTHGIAVSPDGRHAYTTENGEGGTVSVVDIGDA